MPSITLSTISHPMTDAARLARAGQQVGAPKIALPNSFILHAPLEFMARAALLAHVEPSGRDAALDRITWLGNTYEAAGDEVSAPDTTGFPWSTAGATARLTAAVSDGDVDGADVAATWMADHLDPVALAGEVTDLVIPALAAAGHGSIFLDLLIRTDPAFAPRRAFRGIARELARTPDWGLSWFVDRNDTADARTAADADEPTGRGVADGRRLLEALVAPESPGDLGSGSIFATMHLTESSGLAERALGPVLGPIDPVTAARCLRLIAAHSMLQDNPDAAPYGWTHCLTLPQAALGLAPLAARPAQAVAVAATFVLGFRSTQSTVPLDLEWQPDHVAASDAHAALEGPPVDAASAAWWASPEQTAGTWARLATYAAAHEDAHLAKYTLACLRAAVDDPANAHVFAAAAAFLGACWRGLSG